MSSEEEFDNDPENVSEPVRFLRVNYVLPISMNLRLFNNHQESDQESSDQEEMSLEENDNNESESEGEQSSENNTMEIDESPNQNQDESTSSNSNQDRWIVISFYVPSSLFHNHDNLDDILDLIFRHSRPRGPPPTSKKVLDELEEHVFNEHESDSKCVVCQEEFQYEDKYIKLPCNHIYHSDCILPWLKQHNTCPTCRYELESEEEEKENEKRSSIPNEEEEQEEENEVY